MNTFWVLYVKEWKDSRNLIGFLFIAIAMLELYGWYYFDPTMARKSEGGWRYIPFVVCLAGSFLAPAFLLARSFSSEWKSETHYQWFALPVRRWVTVIGKFATAMSQGVSLLLFTGVGIFLISLSDLNTRDQWSLFFNRMFDLSISEFFMVATDFSIVFIVPILIFLVFSLALVTAMEGVKFTVHRHRGLAALVFFGGVIYLFGRYFKDAVETLGFLGRYKPMTMWQSGSMSHGMDLAMVAYPILVSVVLVLVGLWLFEKRVEI